MLYSKVALSRDTLPIQNQPCLCPELPLYPSTLFSPAVELGQSLFLVWRLQSKVRSSERRLLGRARRVTARLHALVRSWRMLTRWRRDPPEVNDRTMCSGQTHLADVSPLALQVREHQSLAWRTSLRAHLPAAPLGSWIHTTAEATVAALWREAPWLGESPRDSRDFTRSRSLIPNSPVV